MDRLDRESTANASEILIVDDVPTNLYMLSVLLRKEGYSVRCAKNGQTALKSVQLFPPDLVLLDIMMPEMSGFEVCQRLKANSLTTTIPVIFISASDAQRHRRHASLVGGVDYIAKPYRPQNVVDKIQAALTTNANQLMSP